ncbi:MAG: hypothetical protein KGO53_01675 [Alphaproteobacteria bacterium]|nr:hypothetical protein [Alphaproteobacteria bacterium]
MDQNTLNLIISAIAGLAAGHGTGAANQSTSLGPVGNTATGAIGGVLGGLIAALVPALQQIGTGTVNGGNLGGGAIGGIVLTAIVSALKNNMGGGTAAK